MIHAKEAKKRRENHRPLTIKELIDLAINNCMDSFVVRELDFETHEELLEKGYTVENIGIYQYKISF